MFYSHSGKGLPAKWLMAQTIESEFKFQLRIVHVHFTQVPLGKA